MYVHIYTMQVQLPREARCWNPKLELLVVISHPDMGAGK